MTRRQRAYLKRQMDRSYLKAPVGGTGPLPSQRSLAVLIVPERSRDSLEACLAAVAEHLPELRVYVYAGSGDGNAGRDELAARHPAVQWVAGEANVGFAAAFNTLVEHIPNDSDLLLLKADARLIGSLPHTRELLRQPRVAAVSPMVRGDTELGEAPWDVASRRQTLIRALVAAAGHSRSLRGTPVSDRYAHQPPESHSVEGALAATCLAISRAAWNAVGGFDEEFLRWGEVADWQARARAAGWHLVLADEFGAELGNSVTGLAPAELCRNHDLARANTALLLEHQRSVRQATVYLAGTTLLERLQRSKRRARKGAGAGRRTGLPAIVITTNRLVYGGAERQKAMLATELDRRGYPVTIVCMQRLGPVFQEFPESVRVVRQPWWAPIVDIPAGPAVLISGDTNTETGFATLWRAAATGRRWLVAAHTPPNDELPIYSRPLTAAMCRADGFIVLAQRHWEMLTAQHRLSGRRFVAPNGVVVTADPSPRIRAVGDPLHLVMLTRIVEHKNPLLLIEALGGLTDMHWELSIFGDGPDRERLQARTPAELRDRVQWRGWSAGPGPALADADLLCVPSRSEAFPVVILEAMARAVPVAASAVCAVPEMLDFGRAGFVVEPVSVSGWRQHLARILADPAVLPSVGRCGFERLRKHYTVEAMADSYLDAINAVL
ncbi:MAG: glycosyltransferase [Mycobacterium sp.]|nr:glycosyltransferase [Mycobacterium sp.]